MYERLDEFNEFFGYDVKERLIELGYTTEEEISEQIRLIGKLFDIVDHIERTEGKEEARKFVNGIMVKQFMDS